MDTRLTTRLPNPQATLSNTYYAPNMPDPVAPQALAQIATPALVQYAPAGGGEGDALQRLFAAFLDAGSQYKKGTEIRIASEEQIRVQKLSQQEVREELQAAAREAEKNGSMGLGSNPYRKMVALEYLGERVMRDEFAPTLTDNIGRFSNPMNEEDPKKFARDTFEALGIDSYFAQRAASNMYDSISSNWIAQVTNQRQAKMVRKNKEDLRDASYHIFRNFAQNEINYDEVVALIDEKSDAFYKLEGGPGREQIVQGLIAAVDAQSMTAEDSAEIDLLQSLINSIRLQKDGALALSTDSMEELDLLENRLNKAEKIVGKLSLDELRDEEGKVDDIFNSIVASSPDLPQEEVWEAMQASMEESGISTQARDNWFVERLSDRYTAFHSRDLELTPDESDALWKGYNDLGDDYNALRQYISTADIPEKLRAEMNARVQNREDAYRRDVESSIKDSYGLLKNVEAVSNQMMVEADRPGVDATDASVLAEQRNQSALNAALDMGDNANQRGLSDDERAIAVREAVVQNDKLWSQVTIDGGADYNVELARELAKDNPEVFTPPVLRTMEKISEAKALSDMGVRLDTASTPEELELDRGSWWWPDRPMVSNVNDVADLWAEKPTPLQERQISTYNTETRDDARKKLSTYAQTSDTAEPFPFAMSRGGVLVVYSGGVIRWKGRTKPTEAELTDPESPFRVKIGGLSNLLTNEEATDEFVSAKRLSGLSDDEKLAGKTDEGFVIDNSETLQNPYETLMVNPDGFIDNLTELLDFDDGLTPDQLKDQHGSNSIVTSYFAYRDMVGLNDAVGFQDFVTLTLSGIGRFTLPIPNADLRKALDLTSE